MTDRVQRPDGTYGPICLPEDGVHAFVAQAERCQCGRTLRSVQGAAR